MLRKTVVAASAVGFLIASPGDCARAAAISPCGDLPPALSTLGSKEAIETFGMAAAADVAVATSPAPDQPGRSTLTISTAGSAPRTVVLTGRAAGLVVSADGAQAFAVVRSLDRKGALRSVDLARIDLATGRATAGTSLPSTARGLAWGAGGSSLLVACRDEIRTFQLPQLTSGPLYRVPGDNVGIEPIPETSRVVVAQSARLVMVDLAEPQTRDGLTLRHEIAAPETLRAMMATVGTSGPVALGEGGHAWCVQLAEFAAAEPAPVAAQLSPEIARMNPSMAPTREPEAVLEALPPSPPAPPREVPKEPTPSPKESLASPIPAGPGSISGLVEGPSVNELAAIVFLGPDNVLHEAARAVPDERRRYTISGLPAGSYRIVASGKAGHVLFCDPPFLSIRVSSNSAVEVPVLKVLRAQ